MAFLTFNDLSSRTFSRASALNESIRAKSYSDINVFLSYRREDRVWVDGIVRFLKSVGVSVYVDYLDQTLEDLQNDQVAKALRDRINGCKKFISLATPNSSKSKWMPWELGLGDRIVNYKNVAMLPLTNTPTYWGDQEYGKIYGRIENMNSYGFNKSETWYVIYPSGDKVGLKQWLLN
jgi:hypothetical protein